MNPETIDFWTIDEYDAEERRYRELGIIDDEDQYDVERDRDDEYEELTDRVGW